MVEGAIISCNAPRHRPLLRTVASLTCFAFVITQLPIQPAIARPTLDPLTTENLVNNVTNYANLATMADRSLRLQERLQRERQIQAAVEGGWLTANASVAQGLQALNVEISRGAEALEKTGSQGMSRIQELAGVVASPGTTGTLEFNYMPVRNPPGAPGGHEWMKIFFRNNLASRVIGEFVPGSGGGFLRDTFNMRYHGSRLLQSYEAVEYRELPGILGGRLTLRTIRWSGNWTADSKFYASSETVANRQMTDERIETTSYNTWTEADIDRLTAKLGEIEGQLASATELAWAAAIRADLASGKIAAGLTTQFTGVTERFYEQYDRNRPLAWRQVVTDPTGVTESRVTVTYMGVKDNKLANYKEDGIRRSLFVSQEDYEHYQAWVAQVLGNAAASAEEKAAAERVQAMLTAGELAPGKSVETSFTVERTYSEYTPDGDPLHYTERRTSSDSTVAVESDVRMTYDDQRQVSRQEDTRTEAGSYTQADLDAFWALVREIEGSGLTASPAEIRFTADLRVKLENGEISLGQAFQRTTTLVRDSFLYNDLQQPVEWKQVTVNGGTTLRERYLAYHNDALGRNLDLLIFSDEETVYGPEDQERLREEATAVLADPDSTEAARRAASQLLAQLAAGEFPSLLHRASVRYRGEVIYNAAGQPIQYTEFSTTNADRLLTLTQLQGIVYDTQGRELNSVRIVQRTGAGTRTGYFLSDGTELTPELLETLLEAYSSDGDPARIQDLVDQGLLQVFDAQGNVLTEAQLEAILRGNPVVTHQATVDELVERGFLTRLADGTYTDGDANPLTQEQVDALVQEYTVTRPSSIQEAIQAGLVTLSDAQGQVMDEAALVEMIQAHSIAAHVATLDELIRQGVIRSNANIPFMLDQRTVSYRHDALYDGMGRLVGVTEDSTDPASGLNTQTRIYGSTYDSEGRQLSSVTISEQNGKSVRSALFLAGSDEELNPMDLHTLMAESNLSLAELIARGDIERREVDTEVDQSTTTYRQQTRYYHSNLTEGFTDLVNTRGFGSDGVTETVDASLTRFNEAGQLLSQLMISRRQGLSTMTVHVMGGQDLTYNSLKLKMDQTGMSLKELFAAGLVTTETRPMFVDSRTETFRHELVYDPVTGFLTRQVDLSAGDQNPGLNEVIFKDASYSTTGQLLQARTVTNYDLFGLEGNGSDIITFYTRDANGMLRFAEAAGIQSSFDVFGSASASRLSQSFLGIAGQARLAAAASTGFSSEVDGSHFAIGQITAYQYDPSGILQGAHGSSSRVGSDIFLNYSQRSLENIYSVINGDARVKVSYSAEDASGVTGVPSFGTGATFSAVGTGQEAQVAGAAAAPWLIDPAAYDKIEVGSYLGIKIYKFVKKSDGSLAGALIDLPGAPIVLTDLSGDPTVTADSVTLLGGTGENRYRYVVTLDGSAVKTTRYNINTAGETESQRIRTETAASGVIRTTYSTVTDEITSQVYAVGLVTVTVRYVEGAVAGSVGITGPGIGATLQNVSAVDATGGQVMLTLAGSGGTVTLAHDAAENRTTIRKDFSGSADEDETVTVQRIGNTLIAVTADGAGHVTRATWTDEASGTVWMQVSASWQENGTANVVISGPNGSTLKYLEGITGITQTADSVQLTDGTTTYSLGFNADGHAAVTSEQGTIEIFRDASDAQHPSGVLTALFRDTAGAVTRTIRVEEGDFLTRVVTYHGAYVAGGTNVIEAEDTYGFGFIRTDRYTDADGTLVWTDGAGQIYRGDAPPAGYTQAITRRTITYLNTETGAASQISRITYDTNDPQDSSASGDVRHVYQEQYTANGATIKIMEIQRNADGAIDWAKRQDYDSSGTRRVMHLQGNANGSLSIVAIFTDPTGARSRILWIPDNTQMQDGVPVRHIVEMVNSETLPQLQVVVAGGSPTQEDLDALVLTE